MNRGCGISVLGKLFGKRMLKVKALDRVRACEGDDVIIGLHEAMFLKGALVVYLLSLLGMRHGIVCITWAVSCNTVYVCKH